MLYPSGGRSEKRPGVRDRHFMKKHETRDNRNFALSGEGIYSIEASHYDVLPQKVAETIMAKARAAKEEEG